MKSLSVRAYRMLPSAKRWEKKSGTKKTFPLFLEKKRGQKNRNWEEENRYDSLIILAVRTSSRNSHRLEDEL